MSSDEITNYLQMEYGLRVLRVTTDTTRSGRPLAIFSLISKTGEQFAVLTASMPELGLPEDLESRPDLNDEDFVIPSHLAAALSDWFVESHDPASPLWLELALPLGLLAAVPWERLLQPALGVPVLRLPYQHIWPRIPEKYLDAVVCFGSTAGNALLGEQASAFFDTVPDDIARTVRFHLFGSRDVYTQLVTLQQCVGGRLDVRVPEPPDPVEWKARAGVNPWFSWIKDAMGATSTDLVHFVCRSDYRANEGAILLADMPFRPPAQQPIATAVFAADILELLNAVGAWCVAFTSSVGNASNAGIRLLQSDIALSRPGPVLVHDMAAVDDFNSLFDAYKFLFSMSHVIPDAPNLSLYCHPVSASARATDSKSLKQLTLYTLEGKFGDEMRDCEIPAWYASTQRELESTAGSLDQVTEATERQARIRARAYVLEVMAKHAQAIDPPEQEERS